ncbi:hypothetical protein C8P63_11039 [Melghirimyces profundicolus]|uniref:Uncharacterized protein n=1 Tax=Melghirimyces profundicolus TaxID=1242148 RepID=A0A2T6BUZ6_9BACL|nr:hypothetical protein [Melghirimyces profundicolus]PTX59895.1 hypothetical protein C8P63_11039 [Melghirimyces profundicolus]
MGTLENLLIHLIAVPAIFLLGRLSAVKVTGFRIRKHRAGDPPEWGNDRIPR